MCIYHTFNMFNMFYVQLNSLPKASMHISCVFERTGGCRREELRSDRGLGKALVPPLGLLASHCFALLRMSKCFSFEFLQ